MLTREAELRLEDCNSILLAGAGGGYDVAGAIPLALELRSKGKQIHLANLSFTNLLPRTGISRIKDHPCLARVDAAAALEYVYCPEAWISKWLSTQHNLSCPVWCFQQTGVRPLRSAYDYLRRELGLDAIVLVDGGIDLILRGDETALGTPAEDLTSLLAVSEVDVQVKLVACVGLGAELRDGIKHAQALERISSLTRAGGYLGAASLSGDLTAAKGYRDAIEYIFLHQSEVKRSHVHRVILRALDGDFASRAGEQHVWISPLMELYWYFDLNTVVSEHLFLRELEWTESLLDVVRYLEGLRRSVKVRPPTDIPL